MTFLVTFFLALGLSVPVSLLTGWMFMLAVGIIHHEWLHTLPTIGYGWSIVVAFLLRSVFTSTVASAK